MIRYSLFRLLFIITNVSIEFVAHREVLSSSLEYTTPSAAARLAGSFVAKFAMMLSSKKKKFLISSSEIAFGLNAWSWKGQQERALLPWICTVVSYQCNTYFVYYHRIPINHLEHPHLESINILPIRSRPRLLFTISPKWRACSQANSRLSLHPFKLLWMHCLDLSFSFFLKYFDELIKENQDILSGFFS